MLEIKKHIDLKIEPQHLVSVKHMGSIYEICYCEHSNKSATIQLIDKDHYINLQNGLVLECNHIDNRSESKAQISQSLKRLRDLINNNVIEPKNWKWITLTYKENMQDTKRLYRDFQKFMQRLRYKYNKYNIDYIIACEPQGRGAWHIHLLLCFNATAPYISNKEIEILWQQGFTKTQKLNDIDNIGAYLTAYLGDIEYTNDNISLLKKNGVNVSNLTLKEVNEIEGIKLKEPKCFIKGGRLYMYPPNFNLYRFSRGIKKPTKEYWEYKQIKEKIGLGQPTYSNGITLLDTNLNYNNKIIYEYYNTKRK